MIDALFSELTEKKITAVLQSELKDVRALDGFVREKAAGRWVRASGPKNILHIFSSNIPTVPVQSFVLGLLLKSSNTGKLSSRDRGFLDIYLQSLKTVNKELWKACRLTSPKDRNLSRLSKGADLVVAYGSDESLEEIRKSIPAVTPFFGYGHRVSLGLYFREALSKGRANTLAKKAAHDIWMVDQRGCLSPVMLYVEKVGEVPPFEFSEYLAEALRKLEKNARNALKAHHNQNRHKIEKLKGLLSVSSGSQFVSIREFTSFKKVFSELKPAQKHLQCVALECDDKKRTKIAEKLSFLGANRICRAGKMQNPPLTWHHDGKLNLASWVRWTDLECDKMTG